MKTKHLNRLLVATGGLCVSAAAHAETYSYDNLNRLVSVAFASGGSQTYSYDAAGNLLAIRTLGGVVVPGVLNIAPVVGAVKGSRVESGAITVAGVTGTAAISVNGGEYQVNGGAWTSTPGVVKNGDVVKVRVTASSAAGTVARAILTIGDKSGTFSATTAVSSLADNGDGTVTDSQTGLTWMRCAEGQAPLTAATCSGTAMGFTWTQASAMASGFSFAGRNDWRLPTVRELQSIVDLGAPNGGPAIDGSVFPANFSVPYWTSTPDATDASKAWRVNFATGETVNDGDRENRHLIRMVSPGQSSVSAFRTSRPTADFVDAGNGTITHTATGLMWQRCAKGQTWSGSACTGSASLYTGNTAVGLTENFAGYSDWRLPNAVELASLVDFNRAKPAANSAVFPEMPSSYFWTSTPSNVYGFATNWMVEFGSGAMTPGDMAYMGYNVRLVRGTLAYSKDTTPTDTECFLDWAEARLPDFLRPAKQPTQTAGTVLYRAYPDTGVYFGLSGTSVVAIGGAIGPNLLTLGELGAFLPTARAGKCR